MLKTVYPAKTQFCGGIINPFPSTSLSIFVYGSNYFIIDHYDGLTLGALDPQQRTDKRTFSSVFWFWLFSLRTCPLSLAY